ncbi:HD domain-containing phosphohydrolase [Aestuariispira insulae]|uniref:PAS domain S-box-containing protein/putative nucleotidyltransferase with HDIG domain n=1 Tax=Aestuariispira insulae TaxID=1461337 RepID=A0A3D9HJP9_9PROT|nr:HD domain-containing phosphohydrolase [Aestuariispira insulae]RED49655.1 PAS domain S-box-containing protein/putative nucleotidyltransferase with HDIG domain [Aestuariispira insulae]
MQRFITLLLLNLAVTFAVGTTIFILLYDTAFEQNANRLRTMVENRKQMIQAVMVHGVNNHKETPDTAREDTLSQIRNAHSSFESFGLTGEFTVAEQIEDQIRFIFRQRHSGIEVPKAITVDSADTSPMQRALNGESGTMIGIDYYGHEVLAAYTPIPSLGIGLVSKIDIDEIRAPFVKDALLGLVLSAALIAVATVAFIRIASPINRRIIDSENLYRRLVEEQVGLVCRSNREGIIAFANESYCQYFGQKTGNLLGTSFLDQIPEDRREEVQERLKVMEPDDAGLVYEHEVIDRDGNVKWMQWNDTLLPGKTRDQDQIISVGLDITEKKLAEQKLLRISRTKMVLMASNELISQSDSPEELFAHVGRILLEIGGYPNAWFARPDRNGAIRPTRVQIPEEESIPAQTFCWYAAYHLEEIYGRQITSPLIIRQGNPPEEHLDFVEVGRLFGYRSHLLLPLTIDGLPVSFLHLHSGKESAFEADEMELLEVLRKEITFALNAMKLREKQRDAEILVRASEIKLERSLFDTVSALANIIEQRDPYTAGHQRNVSQLAVAIARKIGLPDNNIKAIQMGGIIHDIGKISVPIELLTKPGKLTDTEMALIKAHAQNGYEIIKNIEFEGPVAEIVRQHHERLDGSGYPLGLSGDQICLEAKVIAVADSVDAIVSHRPYRPGRSLTTAIEEIEKHSGQWYDPEIVKACVDLIEKDGFYSKQNDNRSLLSFYRKKPA